MAGGKLTLRRLPQILLVVAAIAFFARWEIPVPGSPVPVSGQTFALLLGAGLLGAWDGTVAALLYVLAGALGAPVFADGGAGWETLVGPSGGYLLGFVVASALVGGGVEKRPTFPKTLVWMLVGHGLILTLGGLGLLRFYEASEAWKLGIQPFLVGGMLKSLLAAGLLRAIHRVDEKTHPGKVTPDQEPKFEVGQPVRVVLNDRNRTAREGVVRERVWHRKQGRWHYSLREGSKQISKRYRGEDLEPR